MVWMSRRQRAKYDRLRDFVDGAIPAVKDDKPQVYKAYLKWVANGGYSGHEHITALRPFTGPRLVVRQRGDTFGTFNRLFPNQFYVDKDLAKKFEAAACSSLFGRRLLEATIMHELIHLFDWKGDGKWMKEGVPGSDNGANDFEREAYGEVVTDRFKDWCL